MKSTNYPEPKHRYKKTQSPHFSGEMEKSFFDNVKAIVSIVSPRFSLGAMVACIAMAISFAPAADAQTSTFATQSDVLPAPKTQITRTFPNNSLQGIMTPPKNGVVYIDDKRYTFAPGLIIRDEQNRTLFLDALINKVMVRYVLDYTGQVWRLWILSASEIQSPPQTTIPLNIYQ